MREEMTVVAMTELKPLAVSAWNETVLWVDADKLKALVKEAMDISESKGIVCQEDREIYKWLSMVRGVVGK